MFWDAKGEGAKGEGGMAGGSKCVAVGIVMHAWGMGLVETRAAGFRERIDRGGLGL